MNPPIEEILYEALDTRLGVIVQCGDENEAKVVYSRLNVVMRRDPFFSPLSIAYSKLNPSQIFVIRKADAAETPSPLDPPAEGGHEEDSGFLDFDGP
jgi:hypothetical protein